MSVVLEKEIRVVRELEGEPFYADNIPEAMRDAQKFAGDDGLVAPMTLLVKGFPHSDWLTANSEDVSGSGEFQGKTGNFVVTHHGGVGGDLLLTADVIDSALDMYRNDKGGLNSVYAAVLSDVLSSSTFADFLQGGMPDGSTTQLFSLDQVLAGEHREYLDGFQRFGVVRTLEQAKQTSSGYQVIDGNLAEFDGEGRVTEVKDSQVVAYAGGEPEGSVFLETAKSNFDSGKVGVWHPFNNTNFNPDEDQGRVLFLGVNYGNGLGGVNDLGNLGRCVGVAPEALSARSSGVVVPKPADIVNRVYETLQGVDVVKGVTKKALTEAVRSCYK